MKYFSVFSGVEGIGQGLDGDPIGFSEIDKYASMVLKYHYPKVKNYGDICAINWSEVPDFDLLVGGSPCQDFSIAGKREGIVGSKSRLVWEFIRGLQEKQPRSFIWENVKGVMSSRNGWDFANILSAFSESGYNLWWQVLNAKDFGVPQNRERIFIIGFRNQSPPEIFFEQQNGQTDIESQFITPTISTREGTDNGTYIRYQERNKIKQLNNPKHSNNRLYGSSGLAPSLNTMQGGNRQPKILQAESTQPNYDIRRLTPLEAERLMSWPDNWTKWGINEAGEKIEMSDSQRYKMCGNGVVSAVIKEISSALGLFKP